MSGLLATVVASRGLQPEPVATDVLVHLCSSSSSAAAVMASLLSELRPEATTDGLAFTGQDVDPTSEGRPDLVAADAAGVRLVVEAKFDAELTPAQMSGAYVHKLTTKAPAALVFLVPEDRVRNVWSFALTQFGGAGASVNGAGVGNAGILSLDLPGSSRAVAVVSWQTLLSRLGAAALDSSDHVAVAEIQQLSGLVDWRSRIGWTPLVPGDLGTRSGRQLAALVGILRQASAEVSDGKTKNGSSDTGPGRYITTPSGNVIWLGVWLSSWGDIGTGPLWAQAKAKTAKEVAVLSEAIGAAGIVRTERQKKGDVLIPIELPYGAEREAVRAAIVSQLRALVAVVDGLAVAVVEDETAQ